MTKERFFERAIRDLERGEIVDGAARYILLRNDVLMGLFKRLGPDQRAIALDALADAVHEHGAKSARMYQELDIGEGRNANEKLLAVVEATAPELGWGHWSLTPAYQGDAASLALADLRLSVVNSPFAKGYGSCSTPVCAPIRGMLRVLAEIVFAAPASVVESRCVSVSGGKSCEFLARRVAP